MTTEAPPTINASIFNSANFSSASETTLTRSTADLRYLQLTGGTERGLVNFNSGATVSGDLTVDTNTLTVDSTNNRVGICTTSPTVPLDVTGSAKVSGDLSVDTNTLTVDSTNNRVGICTTSPTVPLDVTGATNISGDLSVDTNVLKVDTTNNRVGINVTSPAVTLDCVNSTTTDNTIARFTSTSLNVGASNQVTVGKSTDEYNSAYLKFEYNADKTSANQLDVGFAGHTPVLQIKPGSLVVPNLNATFDSTSGIDIGPETVNVNSSSIGGTTKAGSFIRTRGWDTASATHTITRAQLAGNASNDNFMGKLFVYISNKSTSTPKVGFMDINVAKTNGLNVWVITNQTTLGNPSGTPGGNFSATPTAAADTSNVKITTDSNCSIAWMFFGCI